MSSRSAGTYRAFALTVALGVACGVYLAEFRNERVLPGVVRFIADLLAGVPSIVVGVLGYELVVVPLGHYSGLAGAFALSFIIAGIGCTFAGLCYAEFAAMIPLAGSAYTYAYATLGELFAWIIGWDLTLEYAMGASTVSSGWSNHFIEFLKIFNIRMPLWMAYDHWTGLRMAQDTVAREMAAAQNPDLAIGTPAYIAAVDAIKHAQTAELLQRAHWG